MIAADVESWQRTEPVGASVYPPLRQRRVTFPADWWKITVPATLLGLFAVVFIAESLRPWILRVMILEPKGITDIDMRSHRPIFQPPNWEDWVGAVLLLLLVYVAAIGLVRWSDWARDKRNQKVYRLASASTPN